MIHCMAHEHPLLGSSMQARAVRSMRRQLPGSLPGGAFQKRPLRARLVPKPKPRGRRGPRARLQRAGPARNRKYEVLEAPFNP